MKNLTGIILLLLLQVVLFAQKPITNIIPFGEEVGNRLFSISGTLLDKDTNEPLIFANVAIYSLDSKLLTGTETDIEGRYHIKNIKPGLYVLETSYIGYKTFRTSRILIFDYDITDYDLYLKEDKKYNYGCGGFRWKVPLINMANPSYITTFTSSDIQNRY